MVRPKDRAADLPFASPRKAAGMKRKGALFVDVREAYEHNAQAIEASLNLPLTKLESQLDRLTAPVVFYCQTGLRTMEASTTLKKIAPPGSVHMAGGLDAWIRDGFAVVGGESADLVGADLLKRLLQSIGKANS